MKNEVMGDTLMLEINGERKILSELGNRKRIEILRYLHQNGWCSSIKVSRAVKLHTAIVSKFLSLCAEHGILEKRFVRGKRRGFYEYRLRAPEFYIKVRIGEEDASVRIRILRGVLAYSEQVFGNTRTEAIKDLLDRKVRELIDSGKGKVPYTVLENVEKQVFEAISDLAGAENAKKIFEKIKEEIKNEKN
ncbi:MAG: hypothetical protein QW115_04050 [Thermoplasmata archaeon]